MRVVSIILFLLVATVVAAQQPISTGARLVGTSALNSRSAAGPSYLPAWSGDGRYLFFLSAAQNLVTNDLRKPYLNVFRHDLAVDQLSLVSFDISRAGGANENCGHITVSTNGGLAAFESFADNLYPGDTNRILDVYLADLNAGAIEAISLDLDGALGSSSSGKPRISPDGRYVAFESGANLVARGTWFFQRAIFLRDRQSSNTTLLSIPVLTNLALSGPSQLHELTPDGRFVLFTSVADFLVTNSPTPRYEQVYVRDHLGSITHWVSENLSQFLPEGASGFRCFNPVLTSNGRFSAYKVFVTNSTSVLIIFHDLETGNSSLVTSNASVRGWLQLSASGSTLVYEEANQIYSWDRDARSTRLLSWNSSGAGPANGPSRSPILSPDGAKLAFISSANDLSPNATNGVFQIYARDLSSSNTYLVTQTTNGQPSARSHELKMFSWHPDGSRIAFESDDSSLVPGDWNGSNDVFVRDLAQNRTVLISKTHSERPASTGIAPMRLADQSITVDSRKAVFSSYDNILDFDDTNRWPNAFMLDLISGKAILLSAADDGLATPPGSIYPTISLDGRYAAFASIQDRSPFERRLLYLRIVRKDLITGEVRFVGVGSATVSGNGAFPKFFSMSGDGEKIAYWHFGSAGAEIYVHDFALGTDVPMLPPTNITSVAYAPLISPDGTAVLFESDAGPIIATNAISGTNSLFLRELAQASTLLLSTNLDGRARPGSTDNARFSATSQFVVFAAAGQVLVHNRLTKSNSIVCQQCTRPSISADGIWVAYEAYESSSQPHQIQVKNLKTGETRLLTQRTNGQPANLNSSSPLITHNGEFVVFLSPASDLIAGDTNSCTDLFIRHLPGDELLRVEGPIINPVLGPDGRTVLFQSASSALAQNDYNALPDLFVLRLGGPDEDNDLLPDDWELSYFNSLSRDGSGDYDSDGHSDFQEFTTGTDPTNQNSVFRILSITSSGSVGTRLLWNSVPGRLYRIEFKSTTSDSAWQPLPGFVRAVDSTASTIDPSVESGSRVYRAVFVP